jgi:hypothetical protein
MISEIRQHFPRTSIFVHTLSSSETSNIAWSRWTQDDDIPEGALPVGHFSRDMDVCFSATMVNRSLAATSVK